MVWAAVIYALIGSYFTWWVGKPLIQANADLRATEADFRFLLVRANESSEAIAIYRGEDDERRNLTGVADQVFSTMQQIANRLARLHWVTGGYGWLALIAPIVLAAPGYFSGALTLGGLMMVVGAFFQVQQALRWYVDRFPGLAEWRATLFRVMTYRTALTRLDTLGRELGTISYVDHPEGNLSLDGLEVYAPNGRITLSNGPLEVSPGERVLIAGTPHGGKSTLFRAIAGLWVWGSGTIFLPPRDSIMFMPHRPYIPLGTLRQALTYPLPPEQFSDDDVFIAMERIHLDRRFSLLDKSNRWDQELTLDEQQRLAFARALLHKPAWIVQDEAMSEFDDDNRTLAELIFATELVDTAVISIGKKSEKHEFYDRVYDLQASPPGITLPLRLAPVRGNAGFNDYGPVTISA